MPVIKSAKKKLKQDKKRTVANKKIENLLKKTVKQASKLKNDKALKEAFSVIDKAAKSKIIHKNKAARMKSSLSKMVPSKAPKAAAAKAPVKETPKKASKTKKTSKK